MEKARKLLGEKDSPRNFWLSGVLEILQPPMVRSLACGGLGSLMLLETGQVYMWSTSSTPVLLEFNRSVNLSSLTEKIIVEQIAAGEDHFAARTTEFSYNLYTWGKNGSGQLGHGDTRALQEPTPVKELDERAVNVRCGRAFTIAQTDSGKVFSWGSNSKGQLGLTRPAVASEETKRTTDASNQHEEKPTTVATEPSLVKASTSFLRNRKETRREEDWYANKPSIVLDMAMSSVPIQISALSIEERRTRARESDDDSMGYKQLHLDARGDHAVAFTSIFSGGKGETNTNRDEISRLARVVAEKRTRISDVQLKFQRLLSQWANRKLSRTKFNDVPSACSAPAELVDLSQEQEQPLADGAVSTNKTVYTGAAGLYGGKGQVVRDPALVELDRRCDRAREQIRQAFGEMEALTGKEIAAYSTLSDMEEEVVKMKADNDRVRGEVADLKQSLAKLEEQRNSIRRLLETGLAKEGDIDLKEEITRQIKNLKVQLNDADAQQSESNHNRRALEERVVEYMNRIQRIKKEQAKVEVQIHQTETRVTLYRRLRLQRQKILQERYTNNIKALWEMAVLTVHSVWKDHVIPNDVFRILDGLQIDPKMAQSSLRKLIDDAVRRSTLGLDLAEKQVVQALGELRSKYARLEVTPILVSRAGAPRVGDWSSFDADFLSSARMLHLDAPVFYVETLNGHRRSVEDFLQHDPRFVDANGNRRSASVQKRGSLADGVEHDSMESFARHSMMLLFRVQFSAVVGDEVMVDSLSFLLDGKGSPAGTHVPTHGFRSQEVVAVIYEDLDGVPSTLARGGYSAKFRVAANADHHIARIYFASPVSIFAQSTEKGMASVWVGLYVEKPCGVMRLFGKVSKFFEKNHMEELGSMSSTVASKQTTSAIAIYLPRTGRAGPSSTPPASADLIPEQFKIHAPVHLFVKAHVLSTCDRCQHIFNSSISERRRINTMLSSVKTPRDIISFAARYRTSQQQPNINSESDKLTSNQNVNASGSQSKENDSEEEAGKVNLVAQQEL